MPGECMGVGSKCQGNAGECSGMPQQRMGVGGKCQGNAGECQGNIWEWVQIAMGL